MNNLEFAKSVLEAHANELKDISLKIHERPELAFQEFFAHDLLTSYLSKAGFNVTKSAFELETAFLATWENPLPTSKKAVKVGFLSEYDALPGLGHACGHNLIAIIGLASAIGLKAIYEKYGYPGTVTLFGCPAEEVKAGKAVMIEKGAFKDMDICLMAHGGTDDLTFARYLAVQTFTVSYKGKSSHASSAPWDGLNALDALVSAYQSIGLLRQQILPTDRIHGVIVNGGDSPNIIPESTTGSFMVRSRTYARLQELLLKVLNCMEAASISSGCKVDIQMNALYKNNILSTPLCDRYQELYSMIAPNAKFLDPMQQLAIPRGGTDMGNVTWICPGLHAIFNADTKHKIHTEGFREAAATDEAIKRALNVACTLAVLGWECATDAVYLEKVRESWKEDLEANSLSK